MKALVDDGTIPASAMGRTRDSRPAEVEPELEFTAEPAQPEAVAQVEPATQPAPSEAVDRAALLSEIRALLARAGVELPGLEVSPNAAP